MAKEIQATVKIHLTKGENGWEMPFDGANTDDVFVYSEDDEQIDDTELQFEASEYVNELIRKGRACE